METNFIHKSAGIIIRDRRLLVERSQGKEFFVSPGGKTKGDEIAKEALVRELKEEFNIEVKEEDLTEFGAFESDAVGKENTKLKMDVFIVKRWEGEPTPSSEVEEIRWIESSNPEGLKLGSIFEHDVIPRLKQMNLID